MRALILTVTALLVVSLSVSAQETTQFRIRVGGGTISGTESMTVTDTPSGHEVSAKVAIKRGGTDINLSIQETLDLGWGAVKYSQEVSGGTGSASATAERKGDVLALAVKTPAGSPTLSVPIKPRLVLMENMVAAPYQVLINVIGGEPGAVTIVVPFQLATIGGTLEAGGTVPGTLDGKPVTATKLLLKVANVSTEIYFDAATKKLLRMYTPGQDA